MGLGKRLIAVGLPAETSKAINGVIGILSSVSTTVTQAAATPLIYDVNVVPNAQAAGAVILPFDAVLGDYITVTNFTGTAISIFPSVGGQINGAGTNVAYSLPASSSVQLQVANTTSTSVPLWYIS